MNQQIIYGSWQFLVGKVSLDMDKEQLFTIAMGLTKPWRIDQVELLKTTTGKELHLYLVHEGGFQFDYEGSSYPVYDHQSRTWRHMNFFEHECYLHALVPRVKTKEGNVLLVEVPWARPGSSFTLLFEAYTALLVHGGMSCLKAGEYIDISGKSVRTIINSIVMNALVSQDLENINHMGIDETSSRKGHNYLTILTDIKRKKVVGIGEGKDQKALSNALQEMELRGADKDKVAVITMDMSKSYIAGASHQMPGAKIVFDRFHIEQSMNKVVDKVRIEESKKYKNLKKSRYLFLKNLANLNEKQKEEVEQLSNSYPTVGKVYRLKEQLKEVLNEAYDTSNLKGINNWLKLAIDSNIIEVIKFSNMLLDHWYGIKTYFQYCISNGYAERVNLKIQEIKRIAKGYTNMKNFKLMIYFHLGGLRLDLPT